MKGLRPYFVVFALCLTLAARGHAGVARAETEYSLQDLYKIALEHSERVKISEEDLFIARQGEDNSLAAILPAVTAFGSYTQFDKARFSVTGALILPNRTWTWGLRVDETLSRVAGLTGSFEIGESEPAPGPVTDFTLEELKSRALEERAEVKSLVQQKKIADDRIRVARSAYWPTVSLTGLYTKQDADMLSASATPESVSGILSLNFPLFEGGSAGLRCVKPRRTRGK